MRMMACLWLMLTGYFSLHAGEILAPTKKHDFFTSARQLIETESGFQSTGWNTILSRGFLPIEPQKKYLVEGEFRSPTGTAEFQLGLAPLDVYRSIIHPLDTITVGGSSTVLAADCHAGSNTLFVVFRQNWKANPAYHVAFETDNSENFSDLPNRKVSKGHLVNVTHAEDEIAAITLSHPLEWNYPSDTPVRLHSDGGIYPCSERTAAPIQWTRFQHMVSGFSHDHTRSQFRAGTKYAKIVILVHKKADESVLEFRNLKFAECKEENNK